MNRRFRTSSNRLVYLLPHEAISGFGSFRVMGEFFRSGAILLMGLIVIGAGIFVVFHSVASG
jgi:hypothetical protein